MAAKIEGQSHGDKTQGCNVCAVHLHGYEWRSTAVNCHESSELFLSCSALLHFSQIRGAFEHSSLVFVHLCV